MQFLTFAVSVLAMAFTAVAVMVPRGTAVSDTLEVSSFRTSFLLLNADIDISRIRLTYRSQSQTNPRRSLVEC